MRRFLPLLSARNVTAIATPSRAQSNPLNAYKLHIADSIAKTLGCDPKIVLPTLQRSKVLENGDLQLAVPALRLKEEPQHVIKKLIEHLPSSSLVERVAADGNHISFFFKPATLFDAVLPSILQNRETWGANPTLGLRSADDPSQGRKRVVVEFSSPNIAKPFHQGHLRSTILGAFVSNLHEISGWDVVRLNYLGDWGKQYGLLALGFEMFGDEKALEDDAIQHLFDVYVKINNRVKVEREAIEELENAGKDPSELKANSLDEQARKYFKAMCEGEPNAMRLWTRFRDLSVDRYKRAYARLNIHFDEYSGESQVKEGTMKDIEAELSQMQLTSMDKGAVVVDFKRHVSGKAGKSLGVALIRKQDGTTLYLTRDLGAMIERQGRYGFDKMIYVVATDQDTHLKQLFKLVEMAGRTDIHEKVFHVGFGLVRGMSTRRGAVVFLGNFLFVPHKRPSNF